MSKCYALYKGEKFLCMGTAEECAKELGIKRETVWFYNTTAHKRRRANGTNVTIAEVVED